MIKNQNELMDRRKAVPIIENMESAQLMDYIQKRLKGEFLSPPLNPWADERPGYLLEKIYEKSQDEAFKSRFRNAIAELLTNEQLRISDPDYLASLLLLCERFIISEAVIPISGMIFSKKLSGMDSADGNLHHRALMAMARMPQGKETDALWVTVMEDSNYTSAAFAALREQGLETIIRYLPDFIRLYIYNPESINMKIAIRSLYEYAQEKEGYDEKEVIEKILESVESNSEYEETMREVMEEAAIPVHEEVLLPYGDSNDRKEKATIKVPMKVSSENLFNYYRIRRVPALNRLKSSVFEMLLTKDVSQQPMIAWKSIAEIEKNSERVRKWKGMMVKYQGR
jgi:hypothetical protein